MLDRQELQKDQGELSFEKWRVLEEHGEKLNLQLLISTVRSGRSITKFGSLEDKGTEDAIRLMKIISKSMLDIKEEMCFTDWQKAFDHANWIKLLEILKIIGD